MLKISKNIHYLDPTNTYDIFDISSSCNNNLITNYDDLDNTSDEPINLFREYVESLLYELNLYKDYHDPYTVEAIVNPIKEELKEAGIILFERKDLKKYKDAKLLKDLFEIIENDNNIPN